MAPRERASARSPMAQVAADAIRVAKERASKASALTEQMEPYVSRRYDEDSVSAWINGRTVPPADALLAAAKAADLSLDERLQEDENPLGFPSLRNRYADVIHVFATRSEFISTIPPHSLFDGSRQIDACGISLNLLCQSYSTSSLRVLLEQGSQIRCLFLAPQGSAIRAREEEENYQAGDLSALTQLNIDILLALRRSLPANLQRHLQIGTYDQTVRFNILIMDDRIAVVQPYLPVLRGIDSPTFVLRRRSGVQPGLFPTFTRIFSDTWNHREPL